MMSAEFDIDWRRLEVENFRRELLSNAYLIMYCPMVDEQCQQKNI